MAFINLMTSCLMAIFVWSARVLADRPACPIGTACAGRSLGAGMVVVTVDAATPEDCLAACKNQSSKSLNYGTY